MRYVFCKSLIKPKDFIKALCVSFFIIMLFECILRIGETSYNDPKWSKNSWYIYSTELGWERRPNFQGRGRKFDSQSFLSVDTEQISNKNEAKIVALGDSTTFGVIGYRWLPVKSTFVEILDKLLPNVSVINLSAPGYTSFQGYKTLLKYGINLCPSLIIVSFNFNDRRYVLLEDDIDSDLKFQKTVKKVKMYQTLEKSYCYRFMKFIMYRTGIINDRTYEKHKNNVDISTLYARVSPENYRNNLVKIAKLAKERGIPIIFLLLKDNPNEIKYLRKGITFLKNSQHELGMRNLRICLESNNVFSVLARKYLAGAYMEQGFSEKAKNLLCLKKVFSSTHGGFPIYSDVKLKFNSKRHKLGRQQCITA